MEFLWTLSELRTPFLNSLFELLTRFGEETVAILVICLIYWCINKRMAYTIGTAYFISSLGAQGMKITFRIDRPWILDPTFEPVGGALEAATSYSFPSGHTTSATALFSSLGLYAKQVWLKVICFALVPIVGFSRMYLGVHTPADVGAAFGFALVVSVIVYITMGRKEPSKRTWTAMSVVLLIIAAAMVAYSFTLYAKGVIVLDYAADCCKAAGAGVGFAVGMFIENNYIRFETSTRKFWHQIVKYVVGLGVLILIKSGLKMIIGDSLAADTFRYFFMIMWAIAIWPVCFKAMFGRKDKGEAEKCEEIAA